MKRIAFIGDIHGNFPMYFNILKYLDEQKVDLSIQLGDFGLGFSQESDHNYTEFIGDRFSRHKFFQGNHDKRTTCNKQPGCLGNYGAFEGMFFVSGAWSIDWNFRTPGRDWWADEELTAAQLMDAISLYEKTLPNVVLSHDCPENVKTIVLSKAQKISTKTGIALQQMWEIHKPSLWIFAHYHTANTFNHEGTTFKCLDCNETTIMDWDETKHESIGTN